MADGRPRPGLIQAALAAGLLAGPAAAQELRIGMKAAIDGSDPHLSYSSNRNVQLHVYEALVAQDAHQRPVPGLAASWRLLDANTWEFALRAGAAFHDGTPVTLADVVFSLIRAREMKGIRTAGPTPMLPAYLTGVVIVSAVAAKDAGEAEFNGGRAALGTAAPIAGSASPPAPTWSSAAPAMRPARRSPGSA